MKFGFTANTVPSGRARSFAKGVSRSGFQAWLKRGPFQRFASAMERREVGSADPTPEALQELGLNAKISVRSRCRLQHFQRPTPPHFRFNASHIPRRCDEHVTRDSTAP